MPSIKREYKDRLFNFIFGSEENKAWTLDLYNAVNNAHYTDPKSLVINTIKEVLYLGMHNDVSFLIANDMNLYEQQSRFFRSTRNAAEKSEQNMPEGIFCSDASLWDAPNTV